MFEFEENSTDRDLLLGFVLGVEKFVSTIIRKGHQGLLPKGETGLHLHKELEPAAREALDEFTQQRRGDVLVAIDRADEATLQSHGLTGKQLRFKLAIIRLRERLFCKLPKFRPFRSVIGAIDTLLDSIVDALGVGGALKELKDAVLDATEDEPEPRD
jgi:hypothetical protein